MSINIYDIPSLATSFTNYTSRSYFGKKWLL